jgi:hypothetical protein
MLQAIWCHIVVRALTSARCSVSCDSKVLPDDTATLDPEIAERLPLILSQPWFGLLCFQGDSYVQRSDNSKRPDTACLKRHDCERGRPPTAHAHAASCLNELDPI